MANDQKYDKAGDLAEEAVKKAADGDDAGAKKLAEKAEATDAPAVEDVLDDLDDDASSEHDLDKLKEELDDEAAKR